MQDQFIAQGLELMLFGMGTVVLFLCLLVVATGLMSRVVTRYFPEPPAATATAPIEPPVIALPQHDPRLVAVISAAIHRYRTDAEARRQ